MLFFVVLRMFVTLNDLWSFLAVPWVGLQSVIVVLHYHTYLFSFGLILGIIYITIYCFFLSSKYRIGIFFGGC